MSPASIQKRAPSLVGLTDEQIVVLAAGGDATAMDYTLTKYQKLVRFKMKGYFLIGADLDDLFQEGMIGLYKAVCDYNPEKLASFRVFAEICVSRQINTAIKTATRQKHEFLNRSFSIDLSCDEDKRSLLDTLAAPDAVDPSAHYENAVMSEHLRTEIFKQLSPLEAEVLECYLHKNSYAGISEKLDRGMKCIDNALQRAKRKIGAAIEMTRA